MLQSYSRQSVTCINFSDCVVTCTQEVNIPRHRSRYSDLPSVDISNESFQRLSFKPRKDAKPKSGKRSTGSRDTPEAPSIMELYPVLNIVNIGWLPLQLE